MIMCGKEQLVRRSGSGGGSSARTLAGTAMAMEIDYPLAGDFMEEGEMMEDYFAGDLEDHESPMDKGELISSVTAVELSHFARPEVLFAPAQLSSPSTQKRKGLCDSEQHSNMSDGEEEFSDGDGSQLLQKQPRTHSKLPQDQEITPTCLRVKVRFTEHQYILVDAKIVLREHFGVMVVLLEDNALVGVARGSKWWTRYSGRVLPMLAIPIVDAIHEFGR